MDKLKCLSVSEICSITDLIGYQASQNYPCSSNVVCGFISTEEKWLNFLKHNTNMIKEKHKDCAIFKNNERWIFIDAQNGFPCAGARFHKLKVETNINREIFMKCIMPCCSMYCKEIEWI